ncbi:unnamed protein product [Pelagomonas calceolata]|uniref:Anaphase-promoting complex subunit 4 WD40 domain-containing protein n=1 Tax=Pelagomonas calceolata TaxID=35677 RepID=A0A7S3ZUR5_9STRA|nr:unnamed protein product [Pelagomonas calceolata]
MQLTLGEAHHGPVTAVVLRGNDVHAAIHGRLHTYDANSGKLQRTRTLLPCRVHGLACNDDGALLAWGVDAVGVARGDAVTTIATETRCVAAAFASSEDVATLTSAGAVERRDAATLARRGATAALQTSGELRCGALRVAGELVKACGGDAFGRIVVESVGRDEAHGGVITSIAWAGEDVLSTSDDRRVTRWRINGDALEKVWTGVGHAARCWCAVAVDAYVVSGSQDGTAIVWRAGDGARVATLRGHAGKHVRCLGGCNGYVATGGHDGTARVWSLRDAVAAQTARRVRAPETTAPTAVCVLRDAVLACFASKKLWRLDLVIGEWRDLGVHGAARRLALDAREDRVALIGGGGSSVVILEVESGSSTTFSTGAAAAVSGWWVGDDLVVASVDRRCCAWRDGACVATLAPVADNALGAVTAVASGGDGRWVVGDSRGRVALIEDGALLWRADAHAKSAVLAVQFANGVLHSFGRDGKMATFEVDDDAPHLASIQPLHVSVSGVCDDVTWGVVGAELVVLDVATNMRRATVAGTNRGRPHGVRVAGNSVRAVAAASDDNDFLIVESETKCVTCGAPLVADGVAAAVTLESGRVVLAGGGGDLAEYAADLREQTRRCSPAAHAQRALARVGDVVIAGSVDVVATWRAGRRVASLRLADADALNQRLTAAAAWDADGGLSYVVGDSAGALRVVKSDRVVATLAWDGAPVCAAAHAPLGDADLVIAGLSTGTIAMWELRGTGTSLALAVAPHAAGVGALAARRVDPDGVLIVSGGDDAKIATVAVRRSSARVEVVALGGCAPVRGLAFTRDGRVVVAARGDGVVSAWRVAEDLSFAGGWTRATAATAATLRLLSIVDVVLGDVRGCCSTEDGALVYGDDGVASVVLC